MKLWKRIKDAYQVLIGTKFASKYPVRGKVKGEGHIKMVEVEK